MTECEVNSIVCSAKGLTSRPPRMRSKKSKCIEFVVGWKDGDCTTEPIYNLIDFDTQEVTEQLIPILRQYLEVVKRYPCTQRKCWLCDRKCSKGTSVCHAHAVAAFSAWLIPYLSTWKPEVKHPMPPLPPRAWYDAPTRLRSAGSSWIQ